MGRRASQKRKTSRARPAGHVLLFYGLGESLSCAAAEATRPHPSRFPLDAAAYFC
jgi:hypothetical protein